MSGSPPPCLAATMMALASLLHSLPRLASTPAFLCLIVAQWEWPDMNFTSLCLIILSTLNFSSTCFAFHFLLFPCGKRPPRGG